MPLLRTRHHRTLSPPVPYLETLSRPVLSKTPSISSRTTLSVPVIETLGSTGETPFIDRVVLVFLSQFKDKIPVYSGLTLDELFRNYTVTESLKTIGFLAVASPNVLVLGLVELLDRVEKVHAPPIQVLHSQIFLLQVLVLVLGARARGAQSSQSLSLERTVTGYVLSVVMSFVRTTTAALIPPSLSKHSAPSENLLLRPKTPNTASTLEEIQSSTGSSIQRSMRLTPLPRVPLHGFEEFAKADDHADAALLSPNAVWEADFLPWELPQGTWELEVEERNGLDEDQVMTVQNCPDDESIENMRYADAALVGSRSGIHPIAPHTDTQELFSSLPDSPPHPPPATSASLHSLTEDPPTLMSLHALVDNLPPPCPMLTLSFLPPAVLTARLAARVIHYLCVTVGDWDVLLQRVLENLSTLSDENETLTTAETLGSSSSVPSEDDSNVSKDRGDSELEDNDFFARAAGDLNVEGGEDITELRMVGFAALDQERLARLLNEISGRFGNLGLSVQASCAAALRLAIFSWLEYRPQEFAALHMGAEAARNIWDSSSSVYSSSASIMSMSPPSYHTVLPQTVSSRRRGSIPGADRLFDALRALASDTSRAADPLRALMWPAIGMLFVLCPDRVAAAAAGDKSILAQIAPFVYTPGLRADTAMRVYSDICRAAFFLPGKPENEDCDLRTVSMDVAEHIADLLERHPPYSRTEAIDVDLYADALVAVYRVLPARAPPLIRAWLEAHCSPAVKLCFVRAAMTLVSEAPAFPWQPSLVPLLQASTKRLNFILQGLLWKGEDTNMGSASSQPMALGEPPDTAQIQRMLTLSIQGLLRLDTTFFLYGPSSVDLAEVNRAMLHSFESPLDCGMLTMCLSTFATLMKRARTVPRGDHFHSAAIKYMEATLFPNLLVLSRRLVHAWHSMETILCINGVYHILKLLASIENNNEDISWTFPEARLPALAVTEVALLATYKSWSPHIILPCIRSLPLLSKVSEAGNLQISDYPIREKLGQWSPVLGADINVPQSVTSTSMAALQKYLRNHLSKINFSYATYISSWREGHYRWSTLVEVLRDSDRGAVLSSGLSVGPDTYKDCETEWVNHTFALASAAGVCMDDAEGSLLATIEQHLPNRMPYHDSGNLIRNFVADLIDLLVSEAPQIRVTAMNALGTELHVRAIPIMFGYLNVVIPEMLRHLSLPPDPKTTLFVDQVMDVLILLADRVEQEDIHFLKCDIGTLVLPILRFIDRPALNISDLHSRKKFCRVLRKIRKRPDVFILHIGEDILPQTLDVAMTWAADCMTALERVSGSQHEFTKMQRNTQVSVLRFASEIAQDLPLRPLDGVKGQDTHNVVSRIFHRYLGVFIRSLDSGRDVESLSKADSDLASYTSDSSSADIEGHILESVISGIANLISANTHIGFKQCLDLGYDEDPRLRAVIMQAFSRVLERGARLEGEGTSHLGPIYGKLCEIVHGNKILAEAIAITCPPSEIDYIVPVLLNVVDNRRGIIDLLKKLIEREVTTADSSVDLFRKNNLCNRLLSAFANQHGYDYLRNMVGPLFEQLCELPAGSSFELDPSKLPLGEDLDQNAALVLEITRSFVDKVTNSADEIPSMLVDVCHYICQIAAKVWPDSKYSVLGGFLFLRFICPAVASPDKIDIEIPRQHPRAHALRRGFVLVAKILQNLANNILFGKEAHLVFLNPLLKSKFPSVATFLTEPFKYPSQDDETDQWLGIKCDETDSIVLHRFFKNHLDDVGRMLLSQREDDPRLAETPNKIVWDRLCSILLDLGPVTDPPTMNEASPATDRRFSGFMSSMRKRHAEPLDHIFYHSKENDEVFILRLDQIRVELTDLEVLMHHILQILLDNIFDCETFTLVVDCTGYSSESELPMEWLSLCIELTPSIIRRKVKTVYLLNTNAHAQRSLRKISSTYTGVSVGNDVISVSSVAELFQNVPCIDFISQSTTGVLESEPSQFCGDVLQRHAHQTWNVTTLDIRVTHLRMTSRRSQRITSRISSKTVEIVPLDDVDDIYRVSSTTYHPEFVLVRNKRGITMQFSSPESDAIIQCIRSAKVRTRPLGSYSIERFGGLSASMASLLNMGLLNICHEEELPRGAANVLLAAVSMYFKYEAAVFALPAKTNYTIFNASMAVVAFSKIMASFAPHLTPDLLTDFRLGFNKAPAEHKRFCLSYLPPWVRNLDLFADPTNFLHDQSSTKLRDTLRSLVDLTTSEYEGSSLMQQYIWKEVSTMGEVVVNLATDEFMRVAIDGGIDSPQCEIAATSITTLSSIHVRARIVMRLRQALRKATLRLSVMPCEATGWNEVAALSRLVLAVGHNPRYSIQDQLLIPEMAHIVTMLAATGSISMRTTSYGIAVNVLHAIAASKCHDEGDNTELRGLMDEMTSPKCAMWFGLIQNQSSLRYTAAKPGSNQIDTPSLEAITQILLRSFMVGAKTTGLVNVWRARWMSLITATAFQEFPYMQTRAFTVLAVLIDSGVDDDFFYQILASLKAAIRGSPEGNSTAVLSMVRCIRKIIPNFVERSHYLAGLFWLTVALLQTGHLPYYIESALLMKITLETLYNQGAFRESDFSTVLLTARSQIRVEMDRLDELSGFSFFDEATFSVSLAFLLYAPAQHQTLRPVAETTIRSILKIMAQSPPTRPGPTRQISPLIVGLFITSLPFCTTSASFRVLLQDSNVDITFWDPEAKVPDGRAPWVPFSLLGISNITEAGLVVSLLLAMVETSYGNVIEREMLYTLLVDISDVCPLVVAEGKAHYLLGPRYGPTGERMKHASSGDIGVAHLRALLRLVGSVASNGEEWISLNTSSSSLGNLADVQDTPHSATLEGLGMQGLLTHLQPDSAKAREREFPAGMLVALLEAAMNV